MFLKPPAAGSEPVDPYDNRFYNIYKGLLQSAIRFKIIALGLVVCIFASALWGFGFVQQSFFPPSTRPQFMVDLWLPQGTHIDRMTETAESVENYIGDLDGVTHVTSLIGKGGMRFLLTYSPEKTNSSYAQMLVDVEDPEFLDILLPEIEAHLAQNYPDLLAYTSRFQLGPGSTGKIQARFSGPDFAELRNLADQTQAIYHADYDSKAVRTDWRQQVKLVKPEIADAQANLNGITRPDVANTLLQAFQGATVGVYRENDLLLPIIMRAEEPFRSNIASIQDLQIWSPAAAAMIPLRQVVARFESTFEDEIIQRRNRKPTITVYADPDKGLASNMFKRIRPAVEALELPPGYELEWGGEYEDSGNAQRGLVASLPFFLLAMILITIMLFNSLKQPLIIWLTVPLSLIGVTAGLLSTSQPFGFMALLGFLSLIGMLIKNAIVLIDEINLQWDEGKELIDAIVDSGLSRLRPVLMAASTTALGLIPLLFDAFFVSMAVTIIFGLGFATLLTMVVVPVLYATFYKPKTVTAA
jgi:multidrug efflux pump subunit AcrB